MPLRSVVNRTLMCEKWVVPDLETLFVGTLNLKSTGPKYCAS